MWRGLSVGLRAVPFSSPCYQALSSVGARECRLNPCQACEHSQRLRPFVSTSNRLILWEWLLGCGRPILIAFFLVFTVLILSGFYLIISISISVSISN